MKHMANLHRKMEGLSAPNSSSAIEEREQEGRGQFMKTKPVSEENRNELTRKTHHDQLDSDLPLLRACAPGARATAVIKDNERERLTTGT